MEKEKEEVFGEGKYGFSRRRIKIEKEKGENIRLFLRRRGKRRKV